jgi:hypothetical protein
VATHKHDARTLAAVTILTIEGYPVHKAVASTGPLASQLNVVARRQKREARVWGRAPVADPVDRLVF